MSNISLGDLRCVLSKCNPVAIYCKHKSAPEVFLSTNSIPESYDRYIVTWISITWISANTINTLSGKVEEIEPCEALLILVRDRSETAKRFHFKLPGSSCKLTMPTANHAATQ